LWGIPLSFVTRLDNNFCVRTQGGISATEAEQKKWEVLQQRRCCCYEVGGHGSYRPFRAGCNVRLFVHVRACTFSHFHGRQVKKWTHFLETSWSPNKHSIVKKYHFYNGSFSFMDPSAFRTLHSGQIFIRNLVQPLATYKSIEQHLRCKLVERCRSRRRRRRQESTPHDHGCRVR
jgi:hypothetical protein